MGYAILAAFALDLLLGDPRSLPHPVRLIGTFIERQEKLYRSLFADAFAGGVALAIVTVGATWLASNLVVVAAGFFHPLVALAAHAVMLYFSLSVSSLAEEAVKVKIALNDCETIRARELLAGLVGRDTATLDEPRIVTATVESVAENSVDAVIAPLFFALLGGGPLALAYKALNTCDSMVGYRTERYEQFGKASARLDDAANFIPARLSLPLVASAAYLVGDDWQRTWQTGMRDRLNHPSPNSAHPEAAFAGALGIRLGGTSHYNGVPSEKPMIGDECETPSAQHIARAVRLMRITALLAVTLVALIRL